MTTALLESVEEKLKHVAGLGPLALESDTLPTELCGPLRGTCIAPDTVLYSYRKHVVTPHYSSLGKKILMKGHNLHFYGEI